MGVTRKNNQLDENKLSDRRLRNRQFGVGPAERVAVPLVISSPRVPAQPRGGYRSDSGAASSVVSLIKSLSTLNSPQQLRNANPRKTAMMKSIHI